MKVNEFIEQMNKMEKEKVADFLHKRLITEYVNFENKIDLCQSIIKNTSYSKISEEGCVWKKQNAMEFLFFNIKLISVYTDVEIEDGNVMENYNALNKLDYIATLLYTIPQREFEEFNDIMSMCKEDQASNERNLTSAIIDLLALVGGIGQTAINNTVDEDSTENVIPIKMKTE